jgi:hypothetical protein
VPEQHLNPANVGVMPHQVDGKGVPKSAEAGMSAL